MSDLSFQGQPRQHSWTCFLENHFVQQRQGKNHTQCKASHSTMPCKCVFDYVVLHVHAALKNCYYYLVDPKNLPRQNDWLVHTIFLFLHRKFQGSLHLWNRAQYFHYNYIYWKVNFYQFQQQFTKGSRLGPCFRHFGRTFFHH